MCQSLNMWSMNSGWLATSARKAKTSSRGLSMFSETLTASTARILFGRAPLERRDRAALRRADDHRALRRLGAVRAAQLADDLGALAARVQVHALARQRRAVTVPADVAICGQRIDRGPQ